jgi:hypothetical protein
MLSISGLNEDFVIALFEHGGLANAVHACSLRENRSPARIKCGQAFSDPAPAKYDRET